jgi:predicted DNA-binding protein YlxM (UPF0122 family)
MPENNIKQECKLTYNIHNQFGRVCSRAGGNAVCGVCIKDINAPAMGFARRPGVQSPKTDQRHIPYTDDDLYRINILAEQGYSRKEIAEMLQRSRDSVSGVCTYYRIRTKGKNLGVNRPKLTKYDVDVIRELFKQGRSGASIASQYNVTRQAISRIKTGKSWKHLISLVGLLTILYGPAQAQDRITTHEKDESTTIYMTEDTIKLSSFDILEKGKLIFRIDLNKREIYVPPDVKVDEAAQQVVKTFSQYLSKYCRPPVTDKGQTNDRQ